MKSNYEYLQSKSQLNIQSCNCCTCHCSCCHCTCNCPCHQNINSRNIKSEKNIFSESKKYPSYYSINSSMKSPNRKIESDLDNFNQELTSLKMKLMNEKKSIKQYPTSLNLNTTNTTFNRNNFYVPKNYVKTDYLSNSEREKLTKSKMEFYSLLNSIKGNDDYKINNQRNNCDDCGSSDRIYSYRNYDNLQSPYKINNYNNPYINQYSDYKKTEPNTYRQISPYKSYDYQRLNFDNPSSNRNYIPTSLKNDNNDLEKDNYINNSNINSNNYNKDNPKVSKRNNKVPELDKIESNYNDSQRIINNPNYISTNSTDNENKNLFKNIPKHNLQNDLSIDHFDYEIIGDNTKDLIINELNTKIEELENNIKEPSITFNNKNENSKINNEYYDNIIQEQKDEIEKLKNQLLNSDNTNNNLNKELQNLKNLLNKNKDDKDLEYKNQLLNLSNDNQKLLNDLNKLKNDLNNMELENRKLNQKIKNNENDISDLENNNQILTSKLSNLPKLEEENKNLMSQILESKKNISTLMDENKKLVDERLGEQKNISDLIEKNKLFNKQVIEYNNDILTLNEENKNLLKKLNDYDTNISNLKSVNTKLKSIKPKFDNLQIQNEKKLTYKGIPYTEEELLKKITKITSKRKILGGSISTSKLMTKLKLETDLNIIPSESKIKVISKIEDLGGSENLIFTIFGGKNIMCYDMNSKSVYFFDFADYNNFSDNFINDEDNGNIFLSYNSFLYILTGKNYDMFYSFNPQKKAMEKLCSLKNNHSKGCLIPFNNNSIICLSGQHNKKCEIYSILKNEWNDMSEMNIERCEFGCCIIQNQYLFSIFGYNYPKNEYLNTIEYLDLLEENSMWKYLNYNNDNLLSLYIKGLLSINYNDEKIILVGGFNGELNKPVEEFYQLILGNNFKNDCYVEDVNRKLKDIQKNKLYMFNSGITEKTDEKNRLYNIAYDNDDRIHIFEIRTMTHDVFNFE